ncbi:DNA methylase [Microcystis aeruginosa KW]|uniref:DNA methylase n=1 Tax=Microcystis aeruginosa KW TaxID=1960155 RepID=A0A1V4BP30_MICAE|nr:endonuclease domain-containing protein [Microcystis aeruginosa]OPF15851.1 DNA methylase [Microcystis aeruginosa KW]
MPLKIIPYNPILKERARQLRQNMTPGEVKLWQHLKGKQMCGYDFDRQRPIDQYIVDFYCKRLMLAIEIDGSSHDSQERQHRDGERQARLESLGVRFLRFREEEVCREIEGVLRVIEEWIKTHPEPFPSNSPPGRSNSPPGRSNSPPGRG